MRSNRTAIAAAISVVLIQSIQAEELKADHGESIDLGVVSGLPTTPYRARASISWSLLRDRANPACRIASRAFWRRAPPDRRSGSRA
jgi:hypothetical protein